MSSLAVPARPFGGTQVASAHPATSWLSPTKCGMSGTPTVPASRQHSTLSTIFGGAAGVAIAAIVNVFGAVARRLRAAAHPNPVVKSWLRKPRTVPSGTFRWARVVEPPEHSLYLLILLAFRLGNRFARHSRHNPVITRFFSVFRTATPRLWRSHPMFVQGAS